MAEKYRTGLKKLNVNIPEWLHKEIMQLAALRNITLTKYVTRWLMKAMMKDNKSK